MSKLDPHVQQFAEELVGKKLENDAFDSVGDFADRFPTVIFCQLAGFPMDHYEQIMDWRNMIMHANDGQPVGRELARAKALELGLETGEGENLPDETALAVRAASAQAVCAYFGELVNQRRSDPKDDLISKLLEADFENERKLPQEELEDFLFLLFMAGLDTVASALGLIAWY